MRINHNIAALNTYRQLSSNQAMGNKALEKLSSGLRINRAGDDAAGLAISEKMRAQIRGLDQAARNAQDGISMIQTAEGALNEVHAILQRMRELATQAANDTNVDVDRNEIQKEINQLTSEINRIGNTTDFNTQKLLNGGATISTINVTELTSPNIPSVTGAISSVTYNNDYEAGSPSTLTVDGLTITADTNGDAYNGYTVTVVDDASEGIAIDHNARTITITLNITGGSTTDISTLSVTENGTNPGSGEFTFSGTAGTATTSTTGTTSGGSDDTPATFDFTVTTNFAVGDTITIDGTTLTAVASGAAAGQFNIGADAAETAANIASALSGGTTNYNYSVSGGTITMTQKVASDPGSTVPTITVAGPGATPGVYEFSISNPVAAGGSYTIDGQEILVVDDATAYSSEIAAGTAILVGANADEQAANLIAAINNNAALSVAYTAEAGSTSTDIKLTQQAASLTAPVVTTSEVAGATGSFTATLQIGANTAQSFTIDINDMRSLALKVSGGTAEGTVTANNGTVAYYRATMEVSDGTDNEGVEYALDVSTHEKATAAISIINDAIETVSAERSKLGAFQNRLEHTINNLGTSSENLTAAESRIRDVDMAKEMMEFTKMNILSQAAQAMLAQANQQPQSVLQLLR